jgi:hypothetical protein
LASRHRLPIQDPICLFYDYLRLSPDEIGERFDELLRNKAIIAYWNGIKPDIQWEMRF